MKKDKRRNLKEWGEDSGGQDMTWARYYEDPHPAGSNLSTNAYDVASEIEANIPDFYTESEVEKEVDNYFELNQLNSKVIQNDDWWDDLYDNLGSEFSKKHISFKEKPAEQPPMQEAKKMKKNIKEADNKRYLLFDEENEDEENMTDDEDIDSIDFDDDINSAIESEDEDEISGGEEEIVDDVANDFETQGISTPNMVSLEDLESVIRKLLGGGNSDQPVEIETTSPATSENGEIEDGFSNPEELTGTPEDLKAVFGHVEGDILDSEFADIQDEIDVAQNKIDSEPTYNEYLTGDASLDELDLYNKRSDDHSEQSNYLEDDDDFLRNTDLVNGVEEEGEVLDTENMSAEPLESISGGVQELGDHPLAGVLDNDGTEEDLSVSGIDAGINRAIGGAQPNIADMQVAGGAASLPEPTTNKTVECCGMPIQIVLTGVMITQKEVQYVAESVKKSGTILKKIVSKQVDELNFIVERSGKKHIINYKDIDRNKNKYPFKIGNKQFQTLEEALIAVKFDDQKAKSEKNNVRKMLNEDILSRSMNQLNESDIFSGFKGKTNYNEIWQVKPVGMVDLKTGLNETYSNITKHSQEKNTLVRTKSGQHLLIKGNLKERSKEGTIKELLDIDSKSSMGLSKVIGVYENTVKGLGQVMFKVKKTTLPLLTWK